MTFIDRFNRLNDAQKQACETIFGPLMVVAGPGSGKTELLSLRIANILRKTDTLAHNILCLTFTDAATKNLQKRLYNLIGAQALNVSIFTFHGFVKSVMSDYESVFSSCKSLNDIKAQEVLFEIMNQFSLSNKLCVKNDGDLIFFKTVFYLISDFKKAALKPENLQQMLEDNIKSFDKLDLLFSDLFGDRLSKKNLNSYYNIVEAFDFPDDEYALLIKSELLKALKNDIDLEETKGLQRFKAKFLTKDESKNIVLKSKISVDKIQDLIFLYDKFQQKIKAANLASFDDLIIDFLDFLKTNPDFCNQLSEKYNFIMVDEFQDTNLAQMQILKLLTSASVHENKPNLMAVGDDDQAIYKFQGASISNILEFKNTFDEVKIIVLNTNYRSTAEVVDLSQKLLGSLQERVVNIYDDVSKNLEAYFKDKKGEVKCYTTTSFDAECKYIEGKVIELINSGVDSREIAVISRNNSDLKKLSIYFDKADIPYELSLSKDIFEIAFVESFYDFVNLLVMYLNADRNFDACFIDFLIKNSAQEDRLELWKLGYMVKKKKSKVKDVFLELDDIELKNFLFSFVSMADDFSTKPFMRVFYDLFKSKSNQFFDLIFVEHFSDYSCNFVLENFQALKLLDGQLQEFYDSKAYTVFDVWKFLDLIKNLNYSLKLPVLFQKHENKVNLITAHSSKGLEFDTVFIIDCNQAKWNRSHASKLRLPETWNFIREIESTEDHLRLFFVAMTRARHSVYFSRHLFRDNGREQIELSFLADLELENNHLDVEVDMATNVEAFEMDIFKDFILSGKESDYFESLIKNWKVSATAVTDFLNIIDNQYIDFVHRHILKIPSQTNKYLLFGSLVHGVIEDLYMEKVDFANYEEEVVLKYLDLRMTKLPILKSEKEDMRKKALLLFPRIFKYLLSKNFVEPGVEVFMNCKLPFNQDFIPLIGAIDVLNIVHKKNLLEIYDFKTGKAINDLYVDKGDQSKKLKAFRYKIQLHFYILLVNLYFGQSYAAFQKQASLIFIESAKLENMQVNLEFDLEFYEKLKVVIQNIYYIVKNNEPMDTSKYSKDFQGILDYFEDLSVVKHRL